jgi:hypothetical protein
MIQSTFEALFETHTTSTGAVSTHVLNIELKFEGFILKNKIFPNVPIDSSIIFTNNCSFEFLFG